MHNVMPLYLRRRNDASTADFRIEPFEDPQQKATAKAHFSSLKALPICGLICLVVNPVYFSYRFKCIFDGQSRSPGWELVAAWAFLALELGIAVSGSLNYLLAFSAIGKLRLPIFLRLLGNYVPTVDVFVTCCGEALDVVMDTVRAASVIDYPKDRYRIFVLDDGDSTELKDQILGLPYENVYYTTRRIEVVTHSKAANLNHGLEYAAALPGGPSEMVAVLDVDMIPLPHWLRALVPHILQDEDIAMANPPQHLYNIPDGDPLGQTMDILFQIIMPLQNALNSTWCSGSGWVARRSAIDQIGGIPTEQINEDILTSYFLNVIGWKIVYVLEPVQWGLVPDTFAGHVKQWKRWCKGVVSTTSVAWDPRAQYMTVGQRFGALMPGFMLAFSVLTMSSSLLVIPGILFSGKPFVIYATSQQLATLLRLGCLQFLVSWAYCLANVRAAEYRIGIGALVSKFSLVPYQFMTLFRLLTPFGQNFTPTGRTLDGQREREARASGSVTRRLKVMLWDCGAGVHVVIISACVAGIFTSLRSALLAAYWIAPATGSGLPILFKEALIRAAWPQTFILGSAMAVQSWTPIAYAISPPTTQNRENFLVRDHLSKVAYPTRIAQDLKRVEPSQRYAIMALLYVSLVFLVSWSI